MMTEYPPVEITVLDANGDPLYSYIAEPVDRPVCKNTLALALEEK
jgi:hypothetical protein